MEKKLHFSKILIDRTIRISILLFLLINALTSFSQELVPFTVDYQETFKGDIEFLSNNVLSEHPTNDYNTPNSINSNIVSVHVDIDSDPTTFNSSSADLSLDACSEIAYAKLYWSASYPWETGLQSGGAAVPRTGDPSMVKLKLPGELAYTTVTGTKIYDDWDTGNENFGNRPYVYVRDITSDIQALTDHNGTYTVADVRAADQYVNATDGNYGCAGGWTIVIVYQNDSYTTKNYTIFDGFAGVNTLTSNPGVVQFTFNGFTTIPNGQVNADFGLIALEGDDNFSGNDHLRLEDTGGTFTLLSDAVNDANDFFNSSITRAGAHITTRSPASTNTLGYDADIFRIDSSNNPGNVLIGNNQTSATFEADTNQDYYYIYESIFSVEVYAPDIQVVKSMEDSAGVLIAQSASVDPLDDITYRFSIQNLGNDAAQNVIIEDLLPFNAAFNIATLYAEDAVGTPIGMSVNPPTPSVPIQYVYNASTRICVSPCSGNCLWTSSTVCRICSSYCP